MNGAVQDREANIVRLEKQLADVTHTLQETVCNKQTELSALQAQLDKVSRLLVYFELCEKHFHYERVLILVDLLARTVQLCCFTLTQLRVLHFLHEMKVLY